MGRHYSRTGNPVESTSASTSTGGINYVTGTSSAGNALPFGSGQVDMLSSGTSYVIPQGVTEIRVTCMGAGGYACNVINSGVVGGGGGGGGFAQAAFVVTPGQIVNYTIGTDVDYENGTLTATAGGEGDEDRDGGLGGLGGVGGGTASPIFVRDGGKGGNSPHGAGGGNGLCSYIGLNIPPDGGSGNGGIYTGGGGVFAGGGQPGNPEHGVSTSGGFLSNYTAWSVLDKNFYNSTKSEDPGVGGYIKSGIKSGFGAGGGGTDSSSYVGNNESGGGVGAGAGATNSGAISSPGIAIMLIEY